MKLGEFQSNFLDTRSLAMGQYGAPANLAVIKQLSAGETKPTGPRNWITSTASEIAALLSIPQLCKLYPLYQEERPSLTTLEARLEAKQKTRGQASDLIKELIGKEGQTIAAAVASKLSGLEIFRSLPENLEAEAIIRTRVIETFLDTSLPSDGESFQDCTWHAIGSGVLMVLGNEPVQSIFRFHKTKLPVLRGADVPSRYRLQKAAWESRLARDGAQTFDQGYLNLIERQAGKDVTRSWVWSSPSTTQTSTPESPQKSPIEQAQETIPNTADKIQTEDNEVVETDFPHDKIKKLLQDNREEVRTLIPHLLEVVDRELDGDIIGQIEAIRDRLLTLYETPGSLTAIDRILKNVIDRAKKVHLNSLKKS